MAKKKDENIQEEQDRVSQEIISDWTMGTVFPLTVNNKTNWDVESKEEKEAREESEPGHWQP